MSLSAISSRAASSLLPGAVSSAPSSLGFSQAGSVRFVSKSNAHISFKVGSELLGCSVPCISFSQRVQPPSVRHLCRAALTAEAEAAVAKQTWRSKSPKDTTVVIVGATGYIGKFVVKEMVKRGYNVIAVAREKSGIGGKVDAEQTVRDFPGATVLFADVSDTDSITSTLRKADAKVDVVISCLASRTGGKKDSWKIDYQATRNSLDAGVACGASHFVLLSAICVQKPLVEFQRAKLKFEAELTSFGNGVTYSIVRPTAFFKSLGGQVQSVQGGGPYVMFGDGKLCACKPISEADLASFISDCVSDVEKSNQILPIGGPGKALTPLEQGEMLFRIVGKEPKFIKVPIGIMDFVIGVLDNLSKLFPNLEDAAEFGKIGRYYAAESMLVLDPKTQQYDADATPSYGTDTLEAFFDRCAREGMAGQELGDQAVF